MGKFSGQIVSFWDPEEMLVVLSWSEGGAGQWNCGWILLYQVYGEGKVLKGKPAWERLGWSEVRGQGATVGFLNGGSGPSFHISRGWEPAPPSLVPAQHPAQCAAAQGPGRGWVQLG